MNETEQILSRIILEYSKDFDMILWSIDFDFFWRKMNLMKHDIWDQCKISQEDKNLNHDCKTTCPFFMNAHKAYHVES